MVTVDNIPSAPRPTRAAENTSGWSSAEHSKTVPSPAMSRMPRTLLDKFENLIPGPWVPVEIAPAMDW